MIYDMPLTDWISMSLHKNSLDNLKEKISKGEEITEISGVRANNRKYIEKILREEVSKQFSETKRPMLEVILNAVDARPGNYDIDYYIWLKLKLGKFVIKDSGTGMGLDDILRFLIIPFSTEKRGFEEIGRFGVGFLSTFNYCVNEPKRTKIVVDTGNGNEAYHLEFYSTGTEVENLRMRLKKIKLRNKGTTVSIRKDLPGKRYILSYLEQNLSGLPTYRANIYLADKFGRKKKINDDSKNKWYSQGLELDILGKKVAQAVGFRRNLNQCIQLTSQGVRVKSFGTQSSVLGAIISFPPAVQVVEGRDEFKIDENYKKCIEGAFFAFEKYLKDNKKTDDFIQAVTNLVPEMMSSFEIKNIKDVPNIEGIKQELLPGKKYALLDWQLGLLSPFLGKTIANLAFPVQPNAYAYWSELYKTYSNVEEEHLNGESFTPIDFIKKTEKNNLLYPNLNLLAQQLVRPSSIRFDEQFQYDSDIDKVVLVNGPRETESPIFIDRKPEVHTASLFINLNHRDVSGEFSPLKVYSILSNYYKSTASVFKSLNQDDKEKRVFSLTSRFPQRKFKYSENYND